MALPEIPIPQISAPHGNCKECKFWQREFTQDMVFTREGNLIPAAALKAQVAASFKFGEKPITMDQLAMAQTQSAACWRHSQWQMQPAMHYCGDFEPEAKQ